MRSSIVPKGLESARLLLWEADVAVIALTSTIFGALLHKPLAGAAAGIAAAWLWQRMTSAYGKGRPIHLLFWYTGLIKLKRTPPSWKRRFIG